MFGLSEFAIILIVVIALLAAKKLPGLARSAGKSARILKAEARAVREADEDRGDDRGTATAGSGGAQGDGPRPRVIRGETVARDTTGSGTGTGTGSVDDGTHRA